LSIQNLYILKPCIKKQSNLTYLSYITIYQHKNNPKYLKEEKPEIFQAISKQIDTADAIFLPRWQDGDCVKFH
jgi:hypothetical protein